MDTQNKHKEEGESEESSGTRSGVGLRGMKASSLQDLQKGDVSPDEGRDNSVYKKGPSTGAGGLELFRSIGSKGAENVA